MVLLGGRQGRRRGPVVAGVLLGWVLVSVLASPARAEATTTTQGSGLVVEPSTVDFGSVAPGATAERPVTVRNRTSASITIQRVGTDSAAFAVAANSCQPNPLT
ncbi:MAG: hypothetical protein ABIW46_08930, partial [Acidimicrobiales bacterium]